MNHQQNQMKHPENKVGNVIWSQIITLVGQRFKGSLNGKHANY